MEEEYKDAGKKILRADGVQVFHYFIQDGYSLINIRYTINVQVGTYIT
jgi:hypothetical protein